jgi:DNA (cytosine-5)-methyltransferase 1
MNAALCIDTQTERPLELKSFMQPNDYVSEPMEEDCRLGVIDLFSGAGGMSLGFRKAGFDIICGVEIERRAAETYSKNFPSAKVLNHDISSVGADDLLDLSARKAASGLVVIGGPPCQPYSIANKQNNGTNHPRASSFAFQQADN